MTGTNNPWKVVFRKCLPALDFLRKILSGFLVCSLHPRHPEGFVERLVLMEFGRLGSSLRITAWAVFFWFPSHVISCPKFKNRRRVGA